MKFIKILKPFVNKFPSLARYYRYQRDLKILNSEIKFRESLGFYFNGLPSMEIGQFEMEETKIFETLLPHCDIFINVGANTGYYVCKALSKNKRTIAFEPNQLNVSILLKNIAANNFGEKFSLFPNALGEKGGVIRLYGDSTGASLIEGWNDQRTSTLVPILVFDDFAKQLIKAKRSLIVVDIEGSELSFLKGAKSLLESETENIFLIEICVCEHQPSGIKMNPNLLETFELMFNHQYNAYTANKKLRKVNLQEIKDICESGVNTLLTHNFIFIKSNLSLEDIDLSFKIFEKGNHNSR